MANTILNVDLLARDLVRVLNDLTGLHAELAAGAREQLAAMRAADAERIAAITANRAALAERAAEREGLRRQMTRRILEGLGAGQGRSASVKLSDLADLLPEPRRSQVLTAATGLRAAVEELQRLERINVLVTHETLRHLGQIVAVMRGGGSTGESYSRGGRRESFASASVFEAVG